MTTQKLEIPLHDKSQVVISRTDTGTIYVELYQPKTLREGHGYTLCGPAALGRG